MITELRATTEQFQDSKPCQPRLAAAQALLCTQGSCIFNFTMKGFFFFLSFFFFLPFLYTLQKEVWINGC